MWGLPDYYSPHFFIVKERVFFKNQRKKYQWKWYTPIKGDCGWGIFGDKYTNNEFVLEGAIVGGPGLEGFYEDNRADYTRNEPSLVSNALFQVII